MHAAIRSCQQLLLVKNPYHLLYKQQNNLSSIPCKCTTALLEVMYHVNVGFEFLPVVAVHSRSHHEQHSSSYTEQQAIPGLSVQSNIRGCCCSSSQVFLVTVLRYPLRQGSLPAAVLLLG